MSAHQHSFTHVDARENLHILLEVPSDFDPPESRNPILPNNKEAGEFTPLDDGWQINRLSP
mgnify:CR=1 FL=1